MPESRLYDSLTTLDVAYDFSAPEYKTCYVVEKDVGRYRAGRGPTVYELTFLDGEETFSIGVPYDVYEAAEEGTPSSWPPSAASSGRATISILATFNGSLP